MGRLLKQPAEEPVHAPDFNRGFTFDFSADEQPQAAWEFSGALKQAREQQFAGATSIDDKIQKRLKEKGQRKQAKADQKKRKKNLVIESDTDGDDDAEDEDSENEPLPGELDDDDDSEDGGVLEVEEEEDDEAAGADGGEETDEDKFLDDEAIDEDGPGSEEEENVSEDEGPSDEEFINDGLISQDEESGEEEEYDFIKDEAATKGAKGKVQNGVANGIGGKKKGKKGEVKVVADKKDEKVGKKDEKAGKKKGEKQQVEEVVSDEEEEEDDSDYEMEEEEDVGDEDGGESEEEVEDEEEDNDKEEDEEEEDDKSHARKRQKGQNGVAITPDPKAKKGKQGFFADKQGRTSSGRTFEELNLSRPLLKAIASLGYKEPTPIQAACVPLALAGRDICGSAVTGSGKTAAYALPILERLLFRSRRVQATYVVILAPTRELAVQVHSMIEKLAQFTDVSAALAVGGLSLQAQSAALKKCPEIVVATPGRLIDHVRNTQSVGLEDLAVLILDEADRLLEMGFKDEIHEIIKLAPKKRQTMLFSATFSSEVSKLVSLSLKQPVRLAVDPSFMAPETLCQEVVRLKGTQASMKEATLLAICSRNFQQGRTIIFTKTKQRAHRLKILFGLLKLPPAGELHGDMTQAARLESLEKFRLGELAFLLATDVAARGLDIVGVETVINYDAPRTLATHMHRIGRTARAGATGKAITLAEDFDRKLLKEVMSKTKTEMKARVVAQQAVSLWQSKVEGAAQDVFRVIQEEREERELRKAEMQVTKAQNMMDHEDEIMARPARTWFQTQKEKNELVKKALLAQEEEGDDNSEDGQGKPKPATNSRKDKADRKRDRKAARAVEEAENKKRNRNKLKTETEEHTKRIKSIKSKTRELVQQGVPVSKASKIASTAVTGVSRKKQKKKKASDANQSGDGLFSGDGVTRAMKDAFKPKMSTQERNTLKRGGKSKAAFKSKKKFKRRK